MHKKALFWIVIILAGLFITAFGSNKGRAGGRERLWLGVRLANAQISTPTLIPTDTPSMAITATPESRELPPVGRNAGLVCAASVLVLIVIGGVIFSSRKRKKD